MVASHEISDDDNDDGDNDESSEEDEPVPKKNELRKKRPAESPSKESAKKKAKLVTQKTGGDSKKGGVHVATPYPSKQDGKALSGSDKSKQQTPKSAGQVSCKSCSKSFNSETALQSHTKAKHGGGK